MTVRKALPFLWKYLAVVATSCMLAFIISREGRAESPPVKGALPTASQFANVGVYAVETTKTDWNDEKRQRSVPVRICSPKVEAGNATRFPAIIFSHGLGGNREGGKFWGEHWASHGYIVVHLQHKGSDESIWQGKNGAQAVDGMKSAMTMSNLGLRVGDVHFAIDQIIRLGKSGDAVFKFADTSKIGMSGHSFGAQTTMAVSGQSSPNIAGQTGLDKRIVAAVAFSPNARNKRNLESQFGDMRLPFFSITGNKDGELLNDGTKPEHRELPYRNMPAGDKFLAVYEGGDHMVFGGHVLKGRRPETERDREIQQDVKASTLAFWNTYLKNDPGSSEWLRRGFRTTLAVQDVFEFK
jgi:dienelactone hydrolase